MFYPPCAVSGVPWVWDIWEGHSFLWQHLTPLKVSGSDLHHWAGKEESMDRTLGG